MAVGTGILGLPADTSNMDMNDIIAFFDSQIEFLQSPEWLNSIKSYDYIKKALGVVPK